MSEDGFDNETASESGHGITRREAIRRGALLGGTALWVAPAVQNIGIARAAAQAASPPCCTSESYDILATFTGTISGSAGPIRSFPTNNGCFSDLAVRTPGQPNATPFATAATACVGGTSAGGACSAFTELQDAAIDLRNINTGPGPGPFDVQVTGSVLRADASCTCGAGGCTLSSCTGTVTLTVAGTSRTVPCAPNTTVTFGITGILTGTIVINEQAGCSVNAVHLTVEALETNPMFTQTIDIVLGHASATCS